MSLILLKIPELDSILPLKHYQYIRIDMSEGNMIYENHEAGQEIGKFKGAAFATFKAGTDIMFSAHGVVALCTITGIIAAPVVGPAVGVSYVTATGVFMTSACIMIAAKYTYERLSQPTKYVSDGGWRGGAKTTSTISNPKYLEDYLPNKFPTDVDIMLRDINLPEKFLNPKYMTELDFYRVLYDLEDLIKVSDMIAEGKLTPDEAVTGKSNSARHNSARPNSARPNSAPAKKSYNELLG